MHNLESKTLDPIVMRKINFWHWNQLSFSSGLRAGPKVVFVDESATGDGKSAAIGGIIVREVDVSAIRLKIDAIRGRLRQSMYEYEYPVLDPKQPLPNNDSRCRTERARLLSGGLPELHATELWHSSHVFRGSRQTPAEQFERHLGWIENVLSLLNEYNIFFRPHFMTDVESSVQRAKRLNTSMFDLLHRLGRCTNDVMKEKSEGLIYDPYVGLQMAMLISIDTDAQRWGWTVRLIADKGKKTVNLKKLVHTFSALGDANLLDTFPIPDFVDSHDDSMLQLADVATYIFLGII